MSLESYTTCLQMRELTGPSTNTCLGASLDAISEVETLSPRGYTELAEGYVRVRATKEMGLDARHVAREVYYSLLLDLGSAALRNVRDYAINSEEEFEELLGRTSTGGQRVLMYVEPNHVVGIRKVPMQDNLWTMHSTWGPGPTNTGEPVSVRELWGYLYHEGRYHHNNKSYKWHNVIVFPPEKKNRHK